MLVLVSCERRVGRIFALPRIVPVTTLMILIGTVLMLVVCGVRVLGGQNVS